MTASEALPAFKAEAGRARYVAAYDAALTEWPVTYEEIDVPTGQGTTHVIASGPADAPPLILLPSFAGAAVVWRLNIAALSQGFRTYAVDVIGQPGKSQTPRPLRGARVYAAWLAELMDGLGVTRASIVGCSFGGFLAMNQAVRTPERVDRVVMISPVGTFASQYWRLFLTMRIRAPLTRLNRRLRGSRQKPGLADLRGKSAYTPPRDTLWSALIGLTMAEAPKVSVINPTVFSARRLRQVTAPALLLIGDRETLYEPAEMLALAKAKMPALSGEIVPDADHIAAMAQPDDVNARILKFLGADAVS